MLSVGTVLLLVRVAGTVDEEMSLNVVVVVVPVALLALLVLLLLSDPSNGCVLLLVWVRTWRRRQPPTPSITAR